MLSWHGHEARSGWGSSILVYVDLRKYDSTQFELIEVQAEGAQLEYQRMTNLGRDIDPHRCLRLVL